MPLSTSSLRVNTQALPPSYGDSSLDGQSSKAQSVASSTRRSSSRRNKDSKKRKKEKDLQDMKASVSRFTRANNHKSALETLQACTALSSISLESVPSSPASQKQWQDLEQEVSHAHKLILNEVAFEGTAVRHEFIPVLKALCTKLTESSNGVGISWNTIYRLLIIRLAPTTSSADSYFHLNALLGTGDLLLQPVDEQDVNSILGNRPDADLSLYEAAGHVHAVQVNHHAYGLYRKSDLASSPWIGVVATVHERMNLTTGASVRQVNVKFV